MIKNFSYNSQIEKSVMFFSAGSSSTIDLLMNTGIYEILASYFYMRKGLTYYENVMIPRINNNKGLFMTDSGVYSFFNAKERHEDYYKEEHWVDYIEEYVGFIERNYKSIYVAANFDLDAIVGKEVVRKWNKKYFEPLEKLTQICYVAHQVPEEGDVTGMKHVEEYCSKYKYVGVNQSMKDQAAKIFLCAKNHNTRIHGFAWTSIPLLKSYPFFSVDSTTWLGGVRYGTTYWYDGKNFKVLDFKHKYVRKGKKLEARKKGIDFEGYLNDRRDPLNLMNLEGWKGARYEYLRMAKLKLKNSCVNSYRK